MLSIKQEIHLPSSSQAPSSKTQCHNPTPPSLLMPKKQIPSPNFSELLLLIQHHHHNIVQQTMLSNKTFIYQAHPKLHHQNPIPQPGQTQCSQTRHSSTKHHSKIHHQNPIPQSGQATMLSKQDIHLPKDHSKLHHQTQ